MEIRVGANSSRYFSAETKKLFSKHCIGHCQPGPFFGALGLPRLLRVPRLNRFTRLTWRLNNLLTRMHTAYLAPAYPAYLAQLGHPALLAWPALKRMGQGKKQIRAVPNSGRFFSGEKKMVVLQALAWVWSAQRYPARHASAKA